MISEEVFCASVASSLLSSYCHYCLIPGENLRKCTGCKSVYYCGADCQKGDWAQHKVECGIFKELSEESAKKFSDSYRLVLRLAGLWTKGEFGLMETEIGPRSLTSMEEHGDDAKLELEATMFLQAFKKFVTKKIAGDEVIKRLFKKSSINSCGLTNEFGHSFGVGLCIKLSGVDHSCKPRTRVVYRGRQVSLLPTTSSAPSDSITIARHAYIDELLPRAARQELLKEKYKFRCRCEGCEDDERNDMMESWVCENCDDGWLPPVENARCEKCGVAAEESHIRTCLMVSETVGNNNRVLVRVDVPEEKKHTLVTMLMGMMDDALSDVNVLRLPCLRYLYKKAVDGHRWLTAKGLGDRILTIYERYRNPEDIAVCYFKYGLAKIYKASGHENCVRDLIDTTVLERFETAYGPESEILRLCLELRS